MVINIKFVTSIERVVLTLWVGGLWTVAFLVAPELFRSLESRQAAGALAGNIFTQINYCGLVAGLILLVLVHRRHAWQGFRQWRTLLLMTMVILVAVSQFALTPMMQELKQARLAIETVSLTMNNQFAILHGLSSALYLLVSLIGMLLVVVGVTRDGK